MRFDSIRSSLFLVGSLWFIPMGTVHAHFPWLVRDAEGKARYYFGETLAQRDYKLPEKIASAAVRCLAQDGKIEALAMETIEKEDFIGRISSSTVDENSTLMSQVTYGIHGGSKLDYYTKHIAGQLATSFPSRENDREMALDASIVDTAKGVKLRITWEGKPLSGMEVKLYAGDGEEQAARKTSKDGEVEFSDKEVQTGLNGIVVGQRLEGVSGSYQDRKYDSASHYLTLTFVKPEVAIPALPLSLTSFGAARSSDAIYVYGGHLGEAHHYSIEEQSGKFLKLDLTDLAKGWEEISTGRRLQGLALVADGDRVIRVGGFEAMNKADEEHDLRSSDEVMAFEPHHGTWSPLPALPEPRSSHDAVIIGHRLYVVGGWTLQGEETTWLSTAWSLDLTNGEARWEALPEPPFRRRALATVALGNLLYVIGGMNESGGPTTEVAYFDTTTKEWKRGPSLEGRAMNGFGASAWTIDGQLIATTIDGDIQILSPDGNAWIKQGSTRDARFFHRLLPYRDRSLLAIGGANMEKGKYLEIETIEIPSRSK